MRFPLLILLKLFFTGIACGQSIRISPDEVEKNGDLTAYVKKRLETAFDTIYLEKGKRAWEIGPVVLHNLSDKTIVLAAGLEIKAKPGAFPEKNQSLFKFVHGRRISIIGNHALLQMNKTEYTDGEWRHLISLRACKDVSIQDLRLESSGGDGIYIGGQGQGTFSKSVYLESIVCNDNKRQGISIVSAEDVFVMNSVFEETKGTAPGAGVDIEPNRASDRIGNINFINCSFLRNRNAGILISLSRLDTSSQPVGIRFENCYLTENHHDVAPKVAAEIMINTNADRPVSGTIEFKNCTIENSKWGMLYSRKREEGPQVSFVDCAAIDIAKNDRSPIYFEVPDYRNDFGPMGGFTFSNMYISSSATKPFLQFRGGFKNSVVAVKNIKGDFTLEGSRMTPPRFINCDTDQLDNVAIEFRTIRE
ncbi:MAG: right-handed parallel beta-helix repeat-containing protein [Flavobacteriaceae bacterium]|nr:right-handed parallel beta-helix repeat-containing protein [Flavobacteriaceae bacterium]